jgi:hypothetical protein
VSQNFEDGVLRVERLPAKLCCGLVTGKIQTTQVTGFGAPSAAGLLFIEKAGLES